MKSIYLILFLIALTARADNATRLQTLTVSGSTAMGQSSTANSKAILDLVSTTKGVLPPRLTTTQRDAITSVPTGLTIFNTTTVRVEYYNGASWSSIGTLAGTEVFTNKTLSGNTATNLISGSGTFTLNTTGTVTAPNATDTLVGKATTDILTNKTMAFASNTFTGSLGVANGGTGASTLTANNVILGNGSSAVQFVAPGTSGNVLTSNGSTWASSAAAGGGSGINYLTKNDTNFESTVGNWAAYADAAATTPVDGTGGSPTVTCTRSTSSPLRGTGSLLITKDAANRQGNGCSVAFTPDSADQAKPISVSFDYTVASGTYADADLTVYLYDVTNSLLIQPTPYQILNAATGLSQKWAGSFQTSSSSTSYRLIVHTASTSAVAYTVKLDNIIVGPTYQPYGAVATDWTSYTPTFNGFGTVTVSGMQWRRVGDSMEIGGYFQTATNTAAAARVSLPTGYTVDSAKTGSVSYACGMVTVGSASSSNHVANVAVAFISGGTGSNISFSDMGDGSTSLHLAEIVANTQFSNSTNQSLFCKVPIAGWSSNVQVSSDADTRVVAAQMTGATATVTGTYSDVTWTTVVSDTHGAMGSTTYTVPVAGYYNFVGTLNTGATSLSAGGGFFIGLLNNTTSTTLREVQFLFDLNVPENESIAFNFQSIYLTAGTTIKMQIKTTGTVGTPVINSSATLNFLSVSRSAGPAQIAASEKVYVVYTSNAATVVTADSTKIDFSTKVQDSHNAWSGTVFTAPKSGMYTISAMFRFSASVGPQLYLYVNSVKKSTIWFATANSNGQGPGTASWYLNAGDTLSILSDSNVTLANTNASTHWISITSQ